eukprot:6478156-Amphidinium_carterae.1
MPLGHHPEFLTRLENHNMSAVRGTSIDKSRRLQRDTQSRALSRHLDGIDSQEFLIHGKGLNCLAAHAHYVVPRSFKLPATAPMLSQALQFAST